MGRHLRHCLSHRQLDLRSGLVYVLDVDQLLQEVIQVAHLFSLLRLRAEGLDDGQVSWYFLIATARSCACGPSLDYVDVAREWS